MAAAADGGLVAAVEALFAASESNVVTAVRLAKSAPASAWNLSARRNRVTSKPRVLAITGQRAQGLLASNVARAHSVDGALRYQCRC